MRGEAYVVKVAPVVWNISEICGCQVVETYEYALEPGKQEDSELPSSTISDYCHQMFKRIGSIHFGQNILTD